MATESASVWLAAAVVVGDAAWRRARTSLWRIKRVVFFSPLPPVMVLLHSLSLFDAGTPEAKDGATMLKRCGDNQAGRTREVVLI